MKQYLQHACYMVLTIGLAVAIVSFLTQRTIRAINDEMDFKRQIISLHVAKITEVKRHPDIMAFVGEKNDKLYFQTVFPNKIIVIDTQLQRMNDVIFNVPSDDRTSSMFSIILTDTGANIMACNLPAIFEVNWQSPVAKIRRFPQKSFSRVVSISENTYVFRGRDTSIKSRDQIFFKGNPYIGITRRENGVSRKTGDLGLSTDGTLSYDNCNNLLVYVPFYGNKFIAMDTNLNKVYEVTTVNYKSKTIATAGYAESNDSRVITNIGPKRVLNEVSLIDCGTLYIKSTARCKTQDEITFKTNSTIDMYDVKDGQYKGTFYIPNHNDEEVLQFTIIGRKVLALYKTNIVLYEIA
jgi:hypothetical protein